MKAAMNQKESIQTLVRRAQAGDREAFDGLVRALRDRLRASVESWARFQLGGHVEVDDVLQETFVRAYRSLGHFQWQGDDSFFRWLCGIARKALAQAVQDSLRAARERGGRLAPRSEPTPSRAARREERFDRLEEALRMLRPEHRTAIILCRVEGLTSKQVAERMERTPEAVRQLLVRAMRELKAKFGDTQSLHLPDRRFATRGEDDVEP